MLIISLGCLLFPLDIVGSGKIEDLIISSNDDYSELSISLSGDADLSFADSKDPKTIKFILKNSLPSSLLSDKAEALLVPEKDPLIDSVSLTDDPNKAETYLSINLKTDDVSFSKYQDRSAATVKLIFKKGRRTVPISNMTADQLMMKINQKKELERLKKEKISKILDEYSRQRSEISETSLEERKKYIKTISLFRDESDEGLKNAIEEARAFIKSSKNLKQKEKLLYAIANGQYLLAKRDPANIKPAIRSLTVASLEFPDSILKYQALMRRAELYKDQELYIEAFNEYDHILRMKGNDKYLVDAILNKGKLFLSQNKLEKANREFVKILLLYPTSDSVREVKYYLGLGFYKNGEYEKAYDIFKDSMRRWPGYPPINPEIYLAIANTEKILGFSNDAEKKFLEISNLYPESKEGRIALLSVADIYYKSGKIDDALKIYTKLASGQISNDESLIASLKIGSIAVTDKGKTFLDNNKIVLSESYENPFENFRSIYKNRKDDIGIEGYLAESKAYQSKGQYLASLESLRQLSDQYKPEQLTDDMKSRISDLAVSTLKKLIKSYHKEDGFFQLLLAYNKYFDQYLSNMTDPEIFKIVGESYNQLTLYDTALKYLEEAIRYSDDENQKSSSLLIMAKISIEKKEYEKAKEYLDRINAAKEDQFIYRSASRLRSDIMASTGNLKEAILELEKILPIVPPFEPQLEVSYRIATLHENLGNNLQAVKIFKSILEDAPYMQIETLEQEPSFFEDALYRITKLSYEMKDYESAKLYADMYRSKYLDSNRKDWLDYMIASADERSGHLNESVSRLESLLKSKEEIISLVSTARLEKIKFKEREYLNLAD